MRSGPVAVAKLQHCVGSGDKKAKVWDVEKERCVFTLGNDEVGPKDGVTSVTINPDGQSLDKSLKLWDLAGSGARSRCRSTLTGHKDFVLSVAFSTDGNWLAAGSKDRSVPFWEPSHISHSSHDVARPPKFRVAISPTGGVCATGSGDHRARLWKFQS